MEKRKRRKLETAGWKVGETQDFLDLGDVEMAMIDVRVSLARELRRKRQERKISQAVFAKRIGSSQSRVAKMEAGDPSVSIDLLVRSLVSTGSTAAEVGEIIAAAGSDAT